MVEPSTTIVSAPAQAPASTSPDGAHLRRPSWLEGFRRITSSGAYIPEIDGLRFIAISAVIVDHLGAIVAQAHGGVHSYTDLGAKGVQLFFVISGFVLATPFAAHYLQEARPVSLRRYFVRRLTRLEPPYLLSLLLMLSLKMAHDASVFPQILSHLFASLFYLHGFVFGTPSTVSVVAWSLEVEVQFYLIMPLLAVVFLIRSRWLRRGLIVVAGLVMTSIQPISIPTLAVPYQGNLLNYLQFFLAGFLLADVYVVDWKNAPPPPKIGILAWGDITWLIGWPLMFVTLTRNGKITQFIFPAMIFLIYYALFYSIWARCLTRVTEITIVGGMCYSIYLIHNAIIQAIGQRLMPILPSGYWPALAICAAAIIPPLLMIAAVYFRMIERPCMRPDWPLRLRIWLNRRVFVEDEAAVLTKSSALSNLAQPTDEQHGGC